MKKQMFHRQKYVIKSKLKFLFFNNLLLVGLIEGGGRGCWEGICVGEAVFGAVVGWVGFLEGAIFGEKDGNEVGTTLGNWDGTTLGTFDGEIEGEIVGSKVGTIPPPQIQQISLALKSLSSADPHWLGFIS